MTKHHLLVALDGSESSNHALNYALRLARETKGMELHLVTVLPEPILYGEISVYVPAEKMAEMQEGHGKEILAPAVAAAKSAGVAYTTDVVVGDIPQALVDKAVERNCDGIVMGTRGIGPVANMIMGSVATKVVHLTKLPVTMVH